MKYVNTTLLLLSLFCVIAMSIIIAGCSFSKEGGDSAATVKQDSDSAATVKQADLESLMNSKCTAICVTTDVPEGDKLTAQSLGERSVEYPKVPIDAITSVKEADGLTAKYGIVQDGVVCAHEVYDSATKDTIAAQDQACALVASQIKNAEDKSAANATLSDFEKSILAQKAKLVYAIKDVAEGKEITSDAVEERPMLQCKIPLDGLTAAQLTKDKIAKYKISAGQIVSQHDLAFKTP